MTTDLDAAVFDEGKHMSEIKSADSLKMIRETLCVAQFEVGASEHASRRGEHMDRIGRLIKDIDRQRPLGPNGKHGDLHTPTCGCDATRSNV